MKLFTVKWNEPEGPASEWHPNESAAAGRAAHLGVLGHGNPRYEPIELPTSKLKMCVWLNQRDVKPDAPPWP